jgi:16S rRNA (guanine966-N2)-methyltransferase
MSIIAAALAPDSYEIAFVDPPYGSKMLDRVLDDWRARGFSRVLAVEHATSHELPRAAARRVLDDSAISIYRA